MSFFGLPLSWFMPSLKCNILKPTFGQPYFNTTAFDNKHEELYCKGTPNIRIHTIEKNGKLSVDVIENCSDSEGISTALRLTKVEFLKLIASNNSRINDILKFLYKNGDKLCLLCSIYIVTEEATLGCHSTKSGILPVSKLLLGHHIILCIPLEERLNINDQAKENVMLLLSKQNNGHLPEYLMRDAAILIDYNEVLHKPAFEMLNELNERKFSDQVVSLFVEVPQQIFIRNYNYFNDRLALATILKLKKFIFLNEEKFLFTSNYNGGKKPLSFNERAENAYAICKYIEKIYNMDFSTFPPPALRVLYNFCKIFEVEYYFAVNESILLPDIPHVLDYNLENVFKFIKALPFSKHENAWIIEANEENSKEIYSKYLAEKTCIMFTKNTKHLVSEFFNESIIWLFTEENKWKNTTEPVLIHDGKIEVLLGMATQTAFNRQTCKKGKLYLNYCTCDIDKEAKAWICTNCKTLILCRDDGYVHCDCGVYLEENFVKKCFKCIQNIDLEIITLNTLPPTPENRTAPTTLITTTPTTEKTLRNWPCMKLLKEIAEKVGKEWENNKISKHLMEHILNVQISVNLEQEDINRKKLKESLDILLMEVNDDSYVMMLDLIDDLIDGNAARENDIMEHSNNFADKFADQMRQKRLSQTLCEEFVKFQMAKHCKLEELQIEELLDALTSTEITLLPGNEFKTDIQYLRKLLIEEQQRRMPKIKIVEVRIGNKVLLLHHLQENTNLHKLLHFNKQKEDTLLEIMMNSTTTNLVDIVLPDSKTIILNLTVNWDETCKVDILPLYNVITISSQRVVKYIPFMDECSSFLSSIDYTDTNPIIGVDYESETAVKDIIIMLGLTEIPKNAPKTMSVCALRGFPELIYFIQTNGRTHFVNPETAVSELLKEATKNIEKSDILLTIPRSFDDTRKLAFSKATEYANLTNVKFVDEITSLAFGYEINHGIVENEIYILVSYFYPNFTISLFKSGACKDKELTTIQIEFEDFKEWENTFFDSIINDALGNNDNKNLSNKINQIFDAVTTMNINFDSIVVALNSSILCKIFADYFPNYVIATIEDPEKYIAQGANLAFHSSSMF